MASYRLPKFIDDLGIANCFICNAWLDEKNYTLEHLIPQWMIRAFKLEGETIVLPDGVRVRYLDYLAPCCRECNCRLLSPIEKRLSIFFGRRKRNPYDLPIQLLAIWACKIFAGSILYYSQDSSAQISRLILTPESSEDPAGSVLAQRIEPVAAANLCRFYLRMLRGQVKIFHRGLEFPFSVFVFDTKLPRQHRQRFDFQLANDLHALYLRLGRWSMLCRFDGGYLALHARQFFQPYFTRKLAPLQVEELAAHFFTLAGRQAHSLLYIHTGGPEIIEYIPTVFKKPFVEPDDSSDFMSWFVQLTRISAEELYPGAHRLTFLDAPSGRLLKVAADA